MRVRLRQRQRARAGPPTRGQLSGSQPRLAEDEIPHGGGEVVLLIKLSAHHRQQLLVGEVVHDVGFVADLLMVLLRLHHRNVRGADG